MIYRPEENIKKDDSSSRGCDEAFIRWSTTSERLTKCFLRPGQLVMKTRDEVTLDTFISRAAATQVSQLEQNFKLHLRKTCNGDLI